MKRLLKTPRAEWLLLPALAASAQYAPPREPSPDLPKAAAERARVQGDDNVGPLVLVDENAAQVIALLEKVSGRMAIRSQELPTLKINFSSDGDMRRSQAEVALESLLALNGVTVVPEGENFLKIVPQAKGAQAEAPPLYTTSVANLEPGERTVARLFSLKNAPVSAVEPVLTGIVNKARGGSVLVMPTGNALLFTDSLLNAQRAEALVSTMDAPGEVMFFPLRNTRASEVVKQLKALQTSGPKTAFSGEAGFEVDEVANQVIVVALANNAYRIRDIINRLDTPSNERSKTEVMALKHVEAERVVKLIENLTRGGSATPGGDAAGINRARATASASGPKTESVAFSGNTPGANGKPAADADEGFSPKFSVVAETRTNALVLFGTESDFRRVRDVVAKVDVKMPQVRIEAVIVEVTLGTAAASGLETLGVGYKTGGGATAGATRGDVNFNTNTPSTPGTGKPPLSVSGSLKDFSLDTVFNLARQDTKIRVLSSPVIVTSHNSAATIKVGQKQPIVTSSASDLQNLSASRSTVEYKDIGLQLDVTPKIGSNGVVEMDIKQTIETIIGVTVIDKNEQPIIGSRAANSYLSAQSDETVVLAGLQSYRERKTKGKVWLLGDIPWLGEWLFRPETTAEEKTELIIFLKPHVITEEDRVPSATTPGLRPESPTRQDAGDRIKQGGFREMNREITYFEKEEREARERAERDARGKPSGK